MKTNPLKVGVISENSAGVGAVTPEMVRARAAELAIMDGHSSSAATSNHFAQAKRELTGVPDMDPKQAILESSRRGAAAPLEIRPSASPLESTKPVPRLDPSGAPSTAFYPTATQRRGARF